MERVRQIAHGWHRLALVLVAAVLAARLMVPAGFMPMRDGHGAGLVLCSGQGPMMAMHGGGHGRKDATRHEPPPCGFAALADVAAGGADMALLVAAIAYVVAQARLRPSLPCIRRQPRLRPPLRAPPA